MDGSRAVIGEETGIFIFGRHFVVIGRVSVLWRSLRGALFATEQSRVHGGIALKKALAMTVCPQRDMPPRQRASPCTIRGLSDGQERDGQPGGSHGAKDGQQVAAHTRGARCRGNDQLDYRICHGRQGDCLGGNLYGNGAFGQIREREDYGIHIGPASDDARQIHPRRPQEFLCCLGYKENQAK